MSKPHRLFFALMPDAGVRRAAAKVQHELGAPGRAAQPENFHATLAFLGMQPAESIPQICEIAGEMRFEPCRLTLDRFGYFRRAGVLWLGASQIPPPLAALQTSLVDALMRAGIGHDPKPWQFHLTLYRRLRTAPPIMPPVAIEWTLHGFDLVESISLNNGVEYHSIGHWEAASSAIAQ